MLRYTLLLVLIHCGSVLSFQTAAPAVKSPLFQQPSTTSLPTVEAPCRREPLPLLSSTVVADSTAELATPTISNPWDRIRTTVQSSTEQLNVLRKKIAKSGVPTALSYSLVSNAFTSVAVSLAWYTFNTQTGLSPISQGQWKPFLALYGGFYAVNSLLKPVRFMLALGVAPHTEKLIANLQSQLGDSKKAAIAGSTALLLATSGIMMASGIGVASMVSGTPIFPGA